jgi:hypothetical protein
MILSRKNGEIYTSRANGGNDLSFGILTSTPGVIPLFPEAGSVGVLFLGQKTLIAEDSPRHMDETVE